MMREIIDYPVIVLILTCSTSGSGVFQTKRQPKTVCGKMGVSIAIIWPCRNFSFSFWSGKYHFFMSVIVRLCNVPFLWQRLVFFVFYGQGPGIMLTVLWLSISEVPLGPQKWKYLVRNVNWLFIFLADRNGENFTLFNAYLIFLYVSKCLFIFS